MGCKLDAFETLALTGDTLKINEASTKILGLFKKTTKDAQETFLLTCARMFHITNLLNYTCKSMYSLCNTKSGWE